MTISLRNLPCGAPIQLFATAWNFYGTSSASQVLVASTKGSVPPRPDPKKLVEVNSTCVTLRTYTWPEQGCPILYWRVNSSHSL